MEGADSSTSCGCAPPRRLNRKSSSRLDGHRLRSRDFQTESAPWRARSRTPVSLAMTLWLCHARWAGISFDCSRRRVGCDLCAGQSGIAQDRDRFASERSWRTRRDRRSSAQLAVAEVAGELGISVLDAERALSVCGPTSLPEHGRPSDVALVLQTSATTGEPRLVPLTHSNLRAMAANTREALHLTAEDRFLSMMPLFHLTGC